MRVITGTAKGRKLNTLENLDIRPTTDRVKEAIFSSIQFEVVQAVVLDLFSGSGQMGIEALSRGAKYAYFVDNSRQSSDVTRDNLISTGLQSNSRVAAMDAIDFLKNTKCEFDIAFLDPPYERGILSDVLPILSEKMSAAGRVICEHELGLDLPIKFGKLILNKKYKYGKIAVTIYTVSEEGIE